MNNYIFHGKNPDSFAWDMQRYQTLKNEDIIRATNLYITKPRVEVRVVPRTQKAAEGGAK